MTYEKGSCKRGNCNFILCIVFGEIHFPAYLPVSKIFAYKHVFVKTLVQISTSMEVNHLIKVKNCITSKMDSSLFRKFWLHKGKLTFIV